MRLRKWLQQKAFSFITGDSETYAATSSRNLHFPGLSSRQLDNNSIIMACTFWAMTNSVQAFPAVEVRGKGGFEQIPEHPILDLLEKPQSMIIEGQRTRLTRRLMAMCLTYSRVLDGNAYLLKVRNGSGQVIGLDWLPHTVVEPVAKKDHAGIVDYYELSGVKHERLAPSEIIHFSYGLDPKNPVKGISRLKAVMRQVMTDNEIAQYCHAIMQQPYPGYIISPKNWGENGVPSLRQSDADHLAELMAAKTSGEKAGGVIVPTFPMDATPMRFGPNDMAIDRVNKMPEERITAVFGIPAIVAGMGAGLDRATFANFKEAREAATEEFLVPLWDDFAETFTEYLLPDFKGDRTARVVFDKSTVRALMEDEDALHERVRSDFEKNVINLAEARAKLGYEPQPGDEKIWAWMLRQAPAIPGQQPAKAAADDRKKAEGK